MADKTAEKTETNDETGATAFTRALNKVNAIRKATTETSVVNAAAKLAEAMMALDNDKRAALEAGLARRRSGDIEVGAQVNVKASFASLYKPKGPYTVQEAITVGGDENKRGGRTFLKVKHANGSVISAPSTCFEMA